MVNNKYIAVQSITNVFGIGILSVEHDIDDYCVSEFFGLDENSKPTKNKICYEKSGRSYFKKSGTKYYLDEFIKTGI